MTPTHKPTRVVAVGDPGSTQQQIITAFSSQPDFELVDWVDEPDRMAREVGAAKPDIILVDSQFGGQPTLDYIDDLVQQFPEVAVVSILPDGETSHVQQAVLAGARAFIIQPFTQINLLSTVRRVVELENRRQSVQSVEKTRITETSRPLRTVTVFSPRGGAGCTTVAINLAMALQEQTDQSVLLMEGKLFFGHLDVMLNIRAQNTLADLIPHASNLDSALIQDVVIKHVSGVHVLLGPNNLQVAQGTRPDDLYAVYMALQRMYDYIVIDGGSALTENTVTLMDSTDRILLLTTPDLTALHDVSHFIQISRSLAYAPEKLLTVLNREGVKGGVKTSDIEASLRGPLFARIPDDGPNALRSINRGIPLVIRYPRNPVSQAIKNLAASLTQINLVEQLSPHSTMTLDRAQREALLVSSQLG